MAAIIKAKKNTRIQRLFNYKNFSFSTARFWLIILIASDGITYLIGKPIVPDVICSLIEMQNQYGYYGSP
jgi:hypothetical protein